MRAFASARARGGRAAGGPRLAPRPRGPGGEGARATRFFFHSVAYRLRPMTGSDTAVMSWRCPPRSGDGARPSRWTSIVHMSSELLRSS